MAEGVIEPWSRGLSPWYMLCWNHCPKHTAFRWISFKELSPEQQKVILYGTGGKKIRFSYHNSQGELRLFDTVFEVVVPNLERRYRETQSDYSRQDIESYMSSSECPQCLGARLKPEVLAVTVNGKNIWEVTRFFCRRSLEFLQFLGIDRKGAAYRQADIKRDQRTFGFPCQCGLEYLTLHRAAGTLSGGEAQRIRLATHDRLKSRRLLYILDEPRLDCIKGTTTGLSVL